MTLESKKITSKTSLIILLAVALTTMTVSNAYAVHPLPTFYPFNSANKSICYQMTALGAVKLNGQTGRATQLKTEIEKGRTEVDTKTDINISLLSSCTASSNQVSAQDYLESSTHAKTQAFNISNPSTMYKIIWYNSNSGKNFDTSSICTAGADPNPWFVANHEFGHFAGLDHPFLDIAPSGHTMMKSQCSSDYATIKTDDINQINGIY